VRVVEAVRLSRCLSAHPMLSSVWYGKWCGQCVLRVLPPCTLAPSLPSHVQQGLHVLRSWVERWREQRRAQMQPLVPSPTV